MWEKQDNYITCNYLRLTDLKWQPQPVTISVNSCWLDHSNKYLQLQDICMYCMETGHWWADSDYPLLKNHTDLSQSPESFRILLSPTSLFSRALHFTTITDFITFHRFWKMGALLLSPGNSLIPLPQVNACWNKQTRNWGMLHTIWMWGVKAWWEEGEYWQAQNNSRAFCQEFVLSRLSWTPAVLYGRGRGTFRHETL